MITALSKRSVNVFQNYKMCPLLRKANSNIVFRAAYMSSSRPLLDSNQNRSDRRRNLSRVLGIGGAISLLAGKAKYVIAAAKLSKFSTLITMFASTATYALFFGWPFAIGFVGQILVHETGHALAMRALNSIVFLFIYSSSFWTRSLYTCKLLKFHHLISSWEQLFR